MQKLNNGTKNKYGLKTFEEFYNDCKRYRNDLDEYIFLSDYIGTNKKIKVKHNCGNEYDIIASNFMKGHVCPICQKVIQKEKCKNLKKKISHNDYLKMFNNLVGDKYSLLSEYIGSKNKITIRCNTCGRIYSVLPTTFQHGYRCKKCSSDNRSSRVNINIFKEKLLEFRGKDINQYTILEFTGLLNPIKLRHSCSKEFYITRAKDFLYNKRCVCPKCRNYINGGHKNYIDYLKNNGYDFIQEAKIEGCKRKRHLSFDIAIYKDILLIALIEFDGPQHKQPIYGNKKFLEQIDSDRIKDNFCLENKIPLLRLNIDNKENEDENLSILENFLGSTTIENKHFKLNSSKKMFMSRVGPEANAGSKCE